MTAMTALRWASFLAPSLFDLYSLCADRVASLLDVPVDIVQGESYEALEAGDYDFAFVCGLPYTQLADRLRPVAAPMLSCHPSTGRPDYYSDVIVRAESDFRRFADLRGGRWSYNEPRSQSGYGIVRQHLAGVGSREFFGCVIESGWHQRSIEMVCSGEVDASAIDCQVLAMARQQDPTLDTRLRVITSLGPSTVQPLVAWHAVPTSLVDRIRSVVVEMGDDPKLASRLSRYFVTRFVGVTDADYDDIRSMQAASAAMGLSTLR
jgi:phosphonate transport system substrate-binding protein